VNRDTDWTERTDMELVTAWRTAPAGAAHPAATELLGRYRMRVYRWSRSYVREHETALDMAQDVLLKAFENIGSLRGDFAPWLFMMTRNRCLDEMRRRKVRGTETLDPDSLPHAGQDPERAWLEQLAEERFLDLLRRTLDPVEQEAISLRCFERMPVDMITEVLDIGMASGARGVLQSARRKLKAALDKERE